jgi:arylsulfatase A-like enzyme
VHGYTCNREGVHVPLVVRVPGMEGRRIERRVALLDIVPTLLEVLGIEAGDSKLDGQSLFVPAFSPGDADPARPILCASIAQSADRTNFFRRSLRTDRRTLLHDAVTAKYELYASEDLLEKEDLVARPEEAEALSRMKDALTASMTGNLLENRLVK